MINSSDTANPETIAKSYHLLIETITKKVICLFLNMSNTLKAWKKSGISNNS